MPPRITSAVSAAIVTATIATGLFVVPQSTADAQRRPGVGMGFYTSTGLVTADVEAGSVTSTTVLAEAPSFAASFLVTGPVAKLRKSAWIVGLRVTPLSFGNNDNCVRDSPTSACQNRRFNDRISLITGGAFDIRSTILRVVAGPVLYSVEGQGTRIGTQVRLDFASPRLSGPTPTLFVTRSMLGSQGGRAVGITTLGAGLRWVRKK